jgi:D-threo-aldose 1-dehydrogenase
MCRLGARRGGGAPRARRRRTGARARRPAPAAAAAAPPPPPMTLTAAAAAAVPSDDWERRIGRVAAQLRRRQLQPQALRSVSLLSNSLAPLQLNAGRTLLPGTDDAIMVGCAPLGAQGKATPTVHALLAAGIKHFDTAPLYGASEQLLGDALASAPPDQLRGVQVHTKCGLDCDAGGGTDFTAASIRARVGRSLARLHLNSDGSGQPYRLSTLRVHHPPLVGADIPPGAALEEVVHPTGGAVAAMVQLRREGTIQHVSIGMNTTEEHNGVVPTISLLAAQRFDSALLAYGWNLFCQEGALVLLECQRRGVPIHVAGIFRYIYNGAPAEELRAGDDPMAARRKKWVQLCKRHKVSLAAAAIAFAALPLNHPKSKVVLGFSSPDEVAPTLKAARQAQAVPTLLWREAQEVGLLLQTLPLPA